MAEAASAPAADGASRPGSRVLESALALVVLLALAIRVQAARVKVLWFDEFLAANLIRHRWSDLLPAVRREAHPPLYFVLLKLWCALFGDGPLGLKSLSVVAGTAAVLLLADAVRRARGETAALGAAVLVALSTVQIDQASDAKPYAVLALLLSLLLWSLVPRPRRRSPAAFAGILAAGVACASTHFYGSAAAAAIALCALISARDRDGRLRAAALLVAVLLASALWLPAAFALPAGASDYIREMWGRVPWWSPMAASTRVALPGWRKPYPAMVGTMLPAIEPREAAGALLVLAIAAGAAVGARGPVRRGRPDGGFLLLCAFSLWPGFLLLESALAAIGRPIALIGRSEVVPEIGLAILVAGAVARRGRGGTAAIAALALLGLWTVIPQWRPRVGPTPVRWEDAIVRRLRAIVPPGARADVVTLGLGRPPFDYYAGGDPRIRLISFPASQDDHPGWTAHAVDAGLAEALSQEARALAAKLDEDLDHGVPVFIADRADPRNAYLLGLLRRDHELEPVPWGAPWFLRVVRAPLLDV